MTFDEALEHILRDERSYKVPILYIIETVMIMEDLGLLKEISYE